MLTTPARIDVCPLFAPLRHALTELLRDLTADAWLLPTRCGDWNVRDVALHLLGGYAGNLSRKRDGAAWATLPPGDDFAARINHHNAVWVEAGRRLSAELIVDLLDHLGKEWEQFAQSLDPDEPAEVIPWAGDAVAPAWLDLARELTEHWHHQQHIRDAVRRPGALDADVVEAVLATFAHALPVALAGVPARANSAAVLVVEGDGGGSWSVTNEAGTGEWILWQGASEDPTSLVRIDVDTAWRSYTLGIDREIARSQARIEGDPALASALLSAVAIIA